ncbi:MAG: hypothetical protein IPH65_02315 [Dehalococcoidia bacterium]|uniref:hypothetical protein n=1 Tax=Candidatus Amarobacter glycogenicus TaxID=3140699 RepID=UPI003135B4BA|nr:hypothetical protein [Dehalococcoidia bacterium]
MRGQISSSRTSEDLSAFPSCSPPLAEQRRIVERVDELLAAVDATREYLARASELLTHLRQSILQAAFSGQLTADLRADEKDGAAIREEGELPPVPPSWEWVPVASLSKKVVDGVHKKPEYIPEGIPFVTVRNLTAGPGIDLSNLNRISPEDHAAFVKRANPERGDLLVSKDGTLGVVRAVRTDEAFSIFVSVAMIKPRDPSLTDYLELALSSPQVQAQMIGTGSGLQHIHLRDLRQDCIPIAPARTRPSCSGSLMPLREASHIESLFSVLQKRTDELRASIIAKAFRGELVRNEAELARQEGRDYESGEQLLVRIKETRLHFVRIRRAPDPTECVVDLG